MEKRITYGYSPPFPYESIHNKNGVLNVLKSDMFIFVYETIKFGIIYTHKLKYIENINGEKISIKNRAIRKYLNTQENIIYLKEKFDDEIQFVKKVNDYIEPFFLPRKILLFENKHIAKYLFYKQKEYVKNQVKEQLEKMEKELTECENIEDGILHYLI